MDVFDALADPVRRDLLRRVADAPATVSDLVAAHAISRPAISRHLRVLREAGLVTATQVGRRRFHQLDGNALAPVRELLSALDRAAAPVAEHQLDALDLEVRRTVRERRARTDATETQEGTG